MIIPCALCRGCPHKEDAKGSRTINPSCPHYCLGVCSVESANRGPCSAIEIAEAFGCTRQAIDLTYERALHRLRSRMGRIAWSGLRKCLLAAADGFYHQDRETGVGAVHHNRA